MRNLRSCLTLAFLALLFDYGLAIEPELIFEIPIGEKTTNGDILDGNLILSSQERFRVLTPEGKESYQANLKPNQGLVTSEDGKFFGITTYSKDASPGFLAAERFELFSVDGKKLWEVTNPKISDFYISNGAKIVVGISSGEGSPESDLVFYDRSGKLISNAKIRFPQKISFSPNGKYVLMNSAKDGLLAFNDSGDLKVNFGLCEEFAISLDAEYVATISEENLRFYHRGKPTGNPLKINPLVRGMSFSPQNKYLGVIVEKNLYLIETKTGKILWQHTLDEPELSFISMDISGDAKNIIVGIDFDKGRKVPPEERHNTGLVYVFNKEGKIIWEKQVSYKLWSAFFPRVQFSSDGKRFCIMTREKIHSFKASWSEE